MTIPTTYSSGPSDRFLHGWMMHRRIDSGPYQELDHVVARISKAIALRNATRLCTGMLLLLITLIIGDWVFPIESPFGRWLMAWGMIGLLASGGAWVACSWLRSRFRHEDVAALLEEDYPMLRGWLVNGLAFANAEHVSRQGDAVPAQILSDVEQVALPNLISSDLGQVALPWEHDSPTLRRAVIQECVNRLNTVNIATWVSGRPLRSALFRLLLASLGLVGLLALNPAGSWRTFQKIVYPWRPEPLPEAGIVADAFDLRVMDCHVQVIPPVYVDRPNQSFSGGFTGLQGSHLVVTAATNVPVAGARLIIHDDQGMGSVLMDVSGSGTRISNGNPTIDAGSESHETDWILRQSGEFGISLQDHHGNWHEPYTRWPFVVQEDRSPSLTWRTPARSTWIHPTSKLQIAAAFQDDFGLADASWMLQVEHNDSSSLEVSERFAWDATQPVNRLAGSLTATIDLGRFGQLRPNDRLTLELSATDLAGNTSRTESRTWNVQSPQTLLSLWQRRFARIINRLRELRQQQRLLIAEMNMAGQRELHRRLVTGSGSAREDLSSFIQELDQSGLPVTHLRDPAANIANRLDQMHRSAVIPLEALLQTVKLGESVGELQRQQVTGYQRQIERGLDEALFRTDQWEQWLQLATEISVIASSQESLIRETRQQVPQSISQRHLPTMTTDRLQPRTKLSMEQMALSRRISLWRVMAEDWLAANSVDSGDAIAFAGYERLNSAIAVFDASPLLRRSHAAAELIREERWSMANGHQAIVLSSLQSILRALIHADGQDQHHPAGDVDDAADVPDGTPSHENAAAADRAKTANDTNGARASSSSGDPRSGTSGVQSGEETPSSGVSLSRDELPWIDLPPRVRESVLRGSQEETIPGYEDVIRDYYRRLADPNR